MSTINFKHVHYMMRINVRAALAFCWVLIVVQLIAANSAFAESDPRYIVGKFKRTDGFTVTAYRAEMDDVISWAGTRCWFEVVVDKWGNRTSTFSHHPEQRSRTSCVIRTTDTSAEIFWFKDGLLPVSHRVEQFDGYSFVEVTTPGKRIISPWLHTFDYRGYYFFTLILISILAFIHGALIKRIKQSPGQGRHVVPKVGYLFGYVVMAIVGGGLLLFELVSSPTSPIVVALLFAIGMFGYRRLSRYSRRGRGDHPTS